MIRKFLLLLLPIAFVFVANAQSVILSEGFDDGQIPAGWTIIDHDGDSYNWDASSWHGATTEVFSGQGMIASASYLYEVGALAPDNWLISPAIVVPDYAALSFYIKSQDEIYADEYYSVYVSQVNTIEGFLENPAVLTGVSTSEWDWKTVDLGDYAGETVYIAFRHHNSSNMYWLDVDEVSVVGGASPFIMLNTDSVHCGTVVIGSYSSPKSVPVRAFGLSSSINVSVSAPFTLSVDDVTYANTAVLTPAGGSLYIRYTPAEIGKVETAAVLSATGAASQQLEVVGVGLECVGINVFPWTESFAMVPPLCWNLIPQDDTTWTSLWYMNTWWASCIGGDSFKTEQLETDVFDFSSAIHPAMSFSFMTNPYYVVNDFVDLNVYVSLDGGSSYSAQPIWKLSQHGTFEEWVPTEACVDMLSLAGESSVKFKFSYEGRGCQMLFNELAVLDLPAVFADHIIYVKADAEGDGTGSSWVNAMRDLKAALRMASYLDTVQLWVAAGSYYGDTSLTSDNAFVMLNGVDVYGGFAGNEPADYDLSQRNLEANVTILDGLNARRVLYQPIEFSKETVWDGFTIQNGQTEGNGAGTYLRGNSVLSHCAISHNMAGHGGGIYAERSSAIYNCLVSNNEALYNGGGLYMNHSTIEVVNSTIVRNMAEGSGSGVYGFGGNLRNCIVWGNKKSQNLSDNIEGFDMIAYYTAVEGGYAGEANIALGDFYNNPMFVSPSNVAGDADTTALVDWHLQDGSVCVNRGDNVVVTSYFDLDGTTRIKLDTVDMGCYESPFYSVPTSGCVYQTVNFTADTCDSYVWNGRVYTQSGDYTQTFMNASGCDSVVTMHLTVNYTNYGDTTAIACDSFDWYEHTGLTQSCDNLTHTFTNAAGCDSIVTLHLTVNYTTYGDTNAVACDSLDWYEHTGITQSCENLTHTFTNAAGCDSIVTLHLTVNYTTYGDTNAVACDSFDWYEHENITQSCDNLTHTFVNAAGCDSIVTLNLTVNYTTYGDTNAVACDSFDWYEHTGITQSCENLTHTFTNAAGCDSIVTLHLTVNYTTYGDTLATACDSFDWYEHTGLTQSCDNLTHTFTNAAGCDSIVTLHLTVNYTTYGDTIAVACDSFDWYEHTGITQSCNNLTHTFTNAAGCDSIVTLNLTVNYTTYGDTTAVACDSFDWYEHTGITQSCNNLTHTFTNAAGCDSIVTLHLTVNHTTYGDTSAVACDSFDWYEHTGITQSCDNLKHTFTNAAGCDSIVTLHLTVNYTTYGDTTAVACDIFDWYEHTGITQSCENLKHTFTNATGCDSIVTLHLTVYPSYHVTDTQTVCENALPYTWNGESFTEAGTKTATLESVHHCDSVVVMILKVDEKYEQNEVLTICQSELPYSWRDTLFEEGTVSNDYVFYRTSTKECDSIVTLHLTVNPTTYGDTTAFACNSFTWYGTTYNVTPDVAPTHTFTNALGCDSVVTLHLTIGHSNTGDTTAFACNSFTWYDTTYTETPDVAPTHTFTNASGCDSVVTLHLTIGHRNTGDTTAFACNSFTWYGTTYIETPDVAPTHTFTNASGCDSVVTLHLTIGHSNTGDTTAFACNSFTWYGTTYTETPDVAPTHTFTNASGCDSVVTLHLTIGHSNTGDTTAFACNSFTWYDTTYTETPDVAPTHTFTNASGCDSVVTLHLTIGHSNTGDTTAFACNSFTWYGTTYTETPEVAPTHTFTNASGCDSVVTLHLTIGHSNTGDTTAFACNSFTWYGTTYTETPDVAPTHTFTNASGCDSVVTLHLTIGHSNTGDTTAFACNSFTWYDTTYTETPEVEPTHTFTNASGCDSVVTLHLTIGHSNTGDTTAFACNSFTWYGTTYTETPAVDPTHTFTNASGCDSVVTLHLTIGHSNTGDTTAFACNSFTWYGTTYTETPEVAPTHTFTNASGCDSVVTLHLTIGHSNTGDTTAFACNSFTWYGTTYTETSEVAPTHTFTNASGCDSVVTLHLTIGHSNIGDTTAFACNSFTWYGTTYTETPEVAPTHTFTNASGCDSVVTLHLTIGHSNTGDTTAFACNSFTWYGTTYTETPDVAPSHTFTNASGCDSVVTLHLTIGHSNTGDTTAFACNSFTWYGTTYTETPDVAPTHTFTNASGCDSVVTLHLTIGHSNTGDTTAFACNSFTWYGTTYTETPEVAPTHTFTNASGCDSVVTLHLTIGHSNTGDTTAFACNSFTWYGSTYTETPDVAPTHTFTNASGCDSVVTLHLTIGHSNTGDTTAFACNSFTWYGTTYTETPEVAPTHTFTNASGCDSVVTLHLTIGYSNTGDTTAFACNSFTWYGTTYTETPEVAPTHTFTNASGCDSVVTLHLTIGYSNTGDTTAIACDSFTWYGQTFTETPYIAPTHTFTNASGCDSVVTLHLTINNSVVGFFEATACDSFTWNEVTYTESGEYVQTFPAANGCDSVVTLLLTINNSVSELIEATACESYTWNGVTYTESGDYTQIFPGANDCDFILTLRLTINTPVTEFVEDTACDIYMWNEEIYTESGDYVQIFPASNGCDSVVTLHLTINNSVEEFVEVAACYSYTWNDSVYTESGEYTQTFNTVDGCDSVVTILLSIGTPVAESFEATVCDSYTWNDSVYTVSGDYTQTFATASGCDSVVTLHLTVNNSVTEFVEVTACNSYTWNAVVYTESGNYTQIFPAANSCDSVVILQLTINNSVAGYFEATACDSYTWNGVTYTASGDYTQTFPAANGCDSVVTLHLTIHESVTIDVYLTINESDLPYTYGDTTFEPGTVQSGDYYFNFTTAEGCDSIIVLHLTVETGVPNHVLASDMKVYPNPTTGSFFVEFEDVNSNTQLQIYDIYGKLIMQYSISDRLTELNIGHLANGVYMLRMIDGNSGSKMVKLVKQ